MSGALLTLLGAGGGASAVTINLSPQVVYAVNFGAPASVAYQLNSNGNAEYSENGGAYGLLEAWCVPAAQAVNYECYATLVSGSLTSGTLSTWLALSSSQSWSVVQNFLGTADAVINVGIRRIGTTTILASADIEMYALYTS
jgi:hypothetical protein